MQKRQPYLTLMIQLFQHLLINQSIGAYFQAGRDTAAPQRHVKSVPGSRRPRGIDQHADTAEIDSKLRKENKPGLKRADINTNMACRVAELSPVKVNKVMDYKQRIRPLMP